MNIEMQLICSIDHLICRLDCVGNKTHHGSLWVDDLTYHIMVDLETIIALPTITFVAENKLV